MFSASLTAKNITFYAICNHAIRVDGVQAAGRHFAVFYAQTQICEMKLLHSFA